MESVCCFLFLHIISPFVFDCLLYRFAINRCIVNVVHIQQLHTQLPPLQHVCSDYQGRSLCMKLISLKNKRLFSFVMLMGYVIILKMYYFNCPSRAAITAVHSDESRSHATFQMTSLTSNIARVNIAHAYLITYENTQCLTKEKF